MEPLLRGRLISCSFAANVLPGLPIFTSPPPDVCVALERCYERAQAALGPASSVRRIADVLVLPLLTILGLTVTAREDEPSLSRVHTQDGRAAGPLVVITPWGTPLERAWRPAVHGAIANDTRWCMTCNGLALRLHDAGRTWSREYVEFAVDAFRDRDAQALLWTFLRAAAWHQQPAVVDQAVAMSRRHGVDLCRALGRGVLESLAVLITALRGSKECSGAVLFEQSLTVMYRVLFLLFAEARGLVPVWHPVYRDRYSLDHIVSSLLAGKVYRGLWQALLAISRLAHAGCSAGELRVTAFNGRLFAPSQAAMFDRRPIADRVMRDAMMAVSSVPGTSTRTRTRIAYRDLDVEQLGGVYEQVLDYEVSSGRAPLVRTGDVRKSHGAFYTPRALTAFLVARTLEPLVHGRSSDQILRLRLVDPAMGSGAFLVAACRYLAAAVEDALVAEGRWHPGEIRPADRVLLRREIASRCLYGVDLNPMAVQLARLSLWLATLAADKPLSFLDHHLIAGDSLVGASARDVLRQPGRQPGRQPRPAAMLPLFASDMLANSLADAVRVRTRLATESDDSAAIVRDKERTLAALAADGTLSRWRRVLDLWCASWFWREGEPPGRAAFGELSQEILQGRSALPRRASDALLAHSADVAARLRFLHWPLAFPEVFADGGFDAVVGNPPWDMVRGDSGSGRARRSRQQHARHTTAFFREAGIYVVEGRGHANRYQFFVERSLQLLRPGGRVGLALPSGIMSDTSGAALRRHLFDRAAIDAVTGMDNRKGIFPIHRSVRFALITATTGRRTERFACRFGISRVEDLESGAGSFDLSRPLLERLSGSDDLGIPELTSDHDLRIVERIGAKLPWLGSENGWNVRFGRELNATDDRRFLRRRTDDPGARLVMEGKHLEPFRFDAARAELELTPGAPMADRVPYRHRLAYREVASATNRLTLIAAVLPAALVTTHTVFCLKNPLPLAQQRVLCALLNSLVANYLIRLRVTTHVTANLMSRLPVPLVTPDNPAFTRLDSLTVRLMNAAEPDREPAYAEMQAVVAHLYGLSRADFEHVLSTFPLIAESIRQASLERFTQQELRHTEALRSTFTVI